MVCQYLVYGPRRYLGFSSENFLPRISRNDVRFISALLVDSRRMSLMISVVRQCLSINDSYSDLRLIFCEDESFTHSLICRDDHFSRENVGTYIICFACCG